MLPHPIERLIEGSEPLLAIENEKRMLLSIEGRRALELASGERSFCIAHPQDASCRIVVGDRDDQLLRGAGIPDEVPLEVRQDRCTIVDLDQQFLKCPGIGVLEKAHLAGTLTMDRPSVRVESRRIVET